MNVSPAKRRKTSTFENGTTDASNVPTDAVSTATRRQGTPSRASYQSPTKASLARFNPKLLPPTQSAGRVTRSGDSRRESLVQQVLGQKRRSSALNDHVSQGSRSEPQTPTINGTKEGQAVANAPNSVAAPESLSTAIARAFNESRPVASQRSPLLPRQPSVQPSGEAVSNSDAQKVDYVRSARDQDPQSRSKIALPNARRPAQAGDDFFETGPPADDTGEPELPPTPTQLGISPQPDRPRGLSLSSSPSGRRERRLAKEAAGTHPLKSSPLKPRDQEADIVSGIHNDEEEDPESGALEADAILADQNDTQETLDDEDLTEKLETKRSLTAQLRRLQSELKQIESLVDTHEDETSDDVEIDDTLYELLTTSNPSCLPPFAATNAKLSSSPEPPVLISPSDASAAHYLNLFSPGNLDLSTTSSTPFTSASPSTSTDLLQRHTLTLTAPSPFPPNIFTLSLAVDANITREQIQQISLPQPDQLKRHGPLRQWLLARLSDGPPLHESSRDVGTLVWAAGLYFAAAVERARIWYCLEHPHEQNDHNLKAPGRPEAPIDAAMMVKILPYLSRESLTLKNQQQQQRATAPEKALHLSYTFDIDWTGEVEERVAICAMGVPTGGGGGKGRDGSAEMDIKDVFERLRSRVGVVEAVRGVRGIVFGEGNV